MRPSTREVPPKIGLLLREQAAKEVAYNAQDDTTKVQKLLASDPAIVDAD